MNSTPAKSQTPGSGVSFLEVTEVQAGQRVDNFLLARLKGVPKSRIYRLIRKGEVRVNKKRVKPDYKICTGDLVRIPPVRIAEKQDMLPPAVALQTVLNEAILLDDPDLMVLNKPSGLPVHGGTGVKTALIAGGVLAGGYLLLSLLSGDDENEEEEEIKNKPGESLTSILASIGAAVALEAGKDWLEDYLEKE